MSETVLVPATSTNVKPYGDSAEPARPSLSVSRGPGPSPQRPSPARHPHRHGRNQGGFTKPQVAPEKPDMFMETVGPIPSSPDYINEIKEEEPTCGVARIMDGPLLNSGMALRILGGREAKKGKWPWQVALMNRMQVIKHVTPRKKINCIANQISFYLLVLNTVRRVIHSSLTLFNILSRKCFVAER